MDWEKAAKVGDRVVCIRNVTRWSCQPRNGEKVPDIGQVYTIREVLVEDTRVIFRLQEIINEKKPYGPGLSECWFGARIFRPIEPRRTDITIFTDMLNNVPAKEDA